MADASSICGEQWSTALCGAKTEIPNSGFDVHVCQSHHLYTEHHGCACGYWWPLDSDDTPGRSDA